MLNFIRATIIGGGLMVTSLFAGQQQSQLVIKAGPCVHLHSRYSCNNYPTGECFWDEADQRCENRNNFEDRCSLINSPSRCINSVYNCFWDYDDQRCERR